MSAPSEPSELGPVEPGSDDDDLELRRRRVKEKAMALRNRIERQAERVDDARRDAHGFVVRHRWPLLGVSLALGYSLARRRSKPPPPPVVIERAASGSIWKAVAGRALQMAAQMAMSQLQSRLESEPVTRTDGGGGSFGGPAGPNGAPETTETRLPPNLPPLDHDGPGAPDR